MYLCIDILVEYFVLTIYTNSMLLRKQKSLKKKIEEKHR